MAKPENDENFPEKQTWSTWEELLLACAVHRHGIDSWDSVADEIQRHNNSTVRTFTAFDCRHKYNDLKRRFSRKLSSSGSDVGETVADEISFVPWLEELRKLRVDELRREVERYDLSISSLQLKVKILEDEREKSLKEPETEIENSDLDKIAQTKESERESNDNFRVLVSEPANSLDPKDNRDGTGSENTNRDVRIAEPVDEEPNQIDEKPAREDSCKGSCESAAKKSAENSEREEPGREGKNSPELVESMDESKGEEETKETSDVQSSASLSRKDSVEQDQPDNEDQSLTVNRNPIESQPLIDFIEILQSHPIGSRFSRRLESQLQETPEYDRMIRQHIDFEIIRSRVEMGHYETSRSKFFRDLLLLINNARVFYGESSSEVDAAKQLNQLIKKHMTLKIFKQSSPPKEESLVTSKEELTVPSLKPTISVPIIACRKRSFLAVRSSASVTEPFKKKTKIVPTVNEKPDSEEEEDETSDKDEEPIVAKKMTRGRTPSTTKRVGSKNVKTSLNTGLPSKGRSTNDSSEPKKSVQEKKGSNTHGGSKKQSAASFLKRMKGVSSSEIGTMKADSSNGKRGAEQRKSNSKNDKGDAPKPPPSQKRLSGKKQPIEKGSSPAKKNTGAASKKSATPSSPVIAKRDSEASEKEAGSYARPKKRSRR